MESVSGRLGWTSLEEATIQTGGRLPLLELARLGLVKVEQEPASGRGCVRGWLVEDASLAAFLGRCRAEVRTRIIYNLPEEIEAVLSCQQRDRQAGRSLIG